MPVVKADLSNVVSVQGEVNIRKHRLSTMRGLAKGNETGLDPPNRGAISFHLISSLIHK
jgi:hypothetical protein